MSTKQKIKNSWDLSPLFKNDTDSDIIKKQKEAKRETNRFVKKWERRVDFLTDPSVLKQALDEYEIWQRFYGHNYREIYYFELRHAVNQENPKIKAKVNLAEELSQKLQNEIQFFELRVAKIDAKLQSGFLNYKPLSPYKHFLEKLFEAQKHLLTEPEEKIMNLKNSTSYSNWVRMTSAFLSKEERNGKNFSELMGLMNDKNKKVRDKAAESFNEILIKHIDTAEHELNSVLQNKKVNDELRIYIRPDKARHVSDDIETEVVDSVIKTITKHFNLSKRYYDLKAKLFGVPKLAYHERNVEYGNIDIKYQFKESVGIINRVMANLDKEFVDKFNDFLNEGRVDVFPKKGKRSGAFCVYGLITHPTYILLNYNNLLDDVRTFAHELGHGINDELMRKSQNSLNYGTPTSTAEVASTFFEDFVIQELQRQSDDKMKLTLNMVKLNQDISSIFRQIAFYNFETELHNNFRKTGYLSKEDIGKLFQKHMTSYMGDAVEQSKGSENWWVYVEHFRYFFYVYSYAMGLLISKSMQASVKMNPDYINKVKEFLSAGSSDSPKNIFSKLGIDITGKKFWEKGILEVENLLAETETLAKKLGKI
jgi:oligoendopeptidase F